MAHNIDETTGSAAMAYVGTEGKPWHGLGNSVPQGASIKQIQKAAGLNWKVEKRPVLFQVGNDPAAVKVDPDHQVIYREDTQAVLDVTGKAYVPTQNHEVLEFFKEYVESGDMFIDTAGALSGGKIVWALAKMGQSYTLPGKDKVEGYVLLMNPHQYGKGMIGKVTEVRVVCWNTMQMALASGGGSVKIWHTHEFNKERQTKAKEQLGIARERFDSAEQDARRLAKLTLSPEDGLKLITPVFGGKQDEPLDQQGRTIQRVMELWAGAGLGAELASSKGTAWGLLNGATQYIDHEYGRSQNARLNYAWLGTGSRLKRDVKLALLQAAA